MPDYSAAPQLDSREQHFRIPGPHQGMSLFLRCLPAADTGSRPRRAVLYVHGATFPSALSIAYRFDGRSWRDALGDAGFDVWGVGFLRIRSFRPLSGNGSARDRQLAAMRGGGCREAIGDRNPVHPRSPEPRKAIPDLAFLGFDACGSLRRRTFRAGRSSGVVRTNRTARTTAL